jgi:regulator of sirC expression with transglutaminase-like and TPR domain
MASAKLRTLVSLVALTVGLTPCAAFGVTSPAQSVSAGPDLSKALNESDLLRAKLDLDRLVDPSIKPTALENEIARLVAAARTFAGPRASVGAQFDAVRKALYQAGPWNDNRPFAYDHADPVGEKVRHKLLSEYLKTRLGNCVTMPTLFMIVGRGVGLHLTLTDAPLHMLVRYTHAGLPALNVEATSGGGFARDEWYRQELPMSDRAIESGLYLRTHTDRETIALMATTVLDYLLIVGRNEEAVKVADAILANDPKEGYTMVKKGTGIAAILKTEFSDKYAMPALIPANLRPRYLELAAANKKAFDDAEALGWEPSQ